MKYICSQCGKLMEPADVFAFDGESYYCSIECYHEEWEEPEEETEIIQPEKNALQMGAIEEEKHWWQKVKEE
jgi:hypothetical protein